jgi:hypothetical protein
MAGIYQKIPSFGLIAGKNGIAPEKSEMHGFFNDDLRMRCARNAALEAMKAFVVEENF